MKIHVGIISDQTLANLIPILIERPAKVYLACSDEMKGHGLDRRLVKICQREHIEVDVQYGVPNAGLHSIQSFAQALLDEIRRSHPDAEIFLNATGGTKLMSLGFVEVFRGVAKSVLYTDTAHHRIEIFPDSSGAGAKSSEMKNVLDVPAYLEAQGFRYVRSVSDDSAWCDSVAARTAICAYLGRRAQSLGGLIGTLNFLASEALDKSADGREMPDGFFKSAPERNWPSALEKIRGAGLIQWKAGERLIRFSDSDSARFLCGGWLEEYAWQVVKQQNAHDVRCSVNVEGEHSAGIRNEFDLLACHGNELLVIECKTLRYDGDNDNEIAYKINTLGQQVRGLFGQTWLLSARKPTDTLRERARLARVRIIGPDELQWLSEYVQDWMKPARAASAPA